MKKATKTQINIKLNPIQNKYFSRSEAREFLFNTAEFKTIVFDFEGISIIGQAFADEIYRVFQELHPDIRLENENMSEGVRFMVERAKNETRKKEINKDILIYPQKAMYKKCTSSN